MHSSVERRYLGHWMTGFILCLAGSYAEAGSWRWALGAQIDPASHGIVDLGYRSESLSIQWLTDTADIRYKAQVNRGEWEIGLRGALFGAELLFSPWENGEPAPEQALRASYLGIDAARAWWYSAGGYLALVGEYRSYHFGKWKDASRPVPKRRNRIRFGAKAGIWNDTIETEVLTGIILDDSEPGFWMEAKLHLPQGNGLGLLNRSWAGWSQGLSRLSKFRLGGLNPYVVSFAGLGWAQYWVERYLVQRVGALYRSHEYPYDIAIGVDMGMWDRDAVRISGLLEGGVKFSEHEVRTSAGLLIFEEHKLEPRAWSAFIWYEKSW